MRIAQCAALVLVLFSVRLNAAFDVDAYELTDSQRALLLRLHKKGLSEQTLEDAARKMEAANRRPPVYVPAHTQQELEAVTDWAVGGAYRSFAKDAGVEFDYASYMADCPNLALFNFGRATGTAHLRHDVLIKFTSVVFALSRALARGQEGFRETYLSMARESGFGKYLK